MGLPDNSVRFLVYAKKEGVSFKQSLMLGRQKFYSSKQKLAEFAARYQQSFAAEHPFTDAYSEPLFKMLGAAVIDSMDVSDYEHANVLHDLNQPVPQTLTNKYTAVIDGGTLEHVFNFPAAVKNCMEMLEVGGHFIAITPANNQMGHGFYQMSPELYYRVFSPANGFEIKKMFIATQDDTGKQPDWYEVADPEKVKSRVMLTNMRPVNLLVIAQKTAAVPIFETTPQQSDYQLAWATNASLVENKKPENVSAAKFLYRKVVPKPVKNFIGNFLHLFKKPIAVNEDLGSINLDHFKKTSA